MAITKLLFSLLFATVVSGTAYVAPLTAQVIEVNTKDETGLTPLMQAAQDGDVNEMKSLVKKGATVNLADQYGWTALTYSVASQEVSKVKFLLENGADINTKDRRGISPLMWACWSGKSNIVKLLLEKGADVNASANDGTTAFSFASAKGHQDVLKLLKKAGGSGPQIDAASLPARITPVDKAPKILNPRSGIPDYPVEARRRGIRGVVRLRILVGTDGSIKKIKVISGLPYGLTDEAVRGALKLTANPAMNDGHPIEYWLAYQVSFIID